jgi:transcriptional regulator
MAEIKDRIISLRNEKNMTQGQLAEALEISPSAIGMYEQGRRKPSYELLERISDYFNVDMDYLMGRSDVRNKYQAGLKYDWEDKLKENGRTEKSNITFLGDESTFIYIPLYESISAGYGSDSAEFIEMIPLYGLKKNGTDYFAVKVKGYSMEPKISDGAIIIIKKDTTIENGEIGAFYLNGESFVKQKRVANGRTILHSYNNAFSDIVINEYDDFKEYGKVVGDYNLY